MTNRLRTTAQVRAEDLADDDHILLDDRWRALMEVHTTGEELESLFRGDADHIIAAADEVRLDTFHHGKEGLRDFPNATPRPGITPAIINEPRCAVSVLPTPTDPRSTKSIATMDPESVVLALLRTGEYTAVKFVREETADAEGNLVVGWAIFQRYALVTIQIPDPHRFAA